jgi:single-strand DNA-binding protein
MQKLIIVGNVGQDAKIETTKNGKDYIKFSVATTKKVGDNTQTTWHDCVKWLYEGKGAGVAQYIKKGDKIYIEGEVTANAYTTNSNELRATLNVNVQTIELLGSKQEGDRPYVPQMESSGHPVTPLLNEEDDLPF